MIFYSIILATNSGKLKIPANGGDDFYLNEKILLITLLVVSNKLSKTNIGKRVF